MQPCVQVHAPRKRLETVVGDHHEQRVIVDLFHHATDEFIHALVELLNHLAPLTLRHTAGGRMIFFEIPPEHVLDAVGGIEDAGAESLLRLVQGIEQHAFAIFVIAVRLREKCIVIEHMFVQRPSVFGEA